MQSQNEQQRESLSAYGKHRGCSRQAVAKAVKNGRLERSVVMVDGRATIPDFAAADVEWDENTRLHEEGSAPRERLARAALMESKARMADLVLRQKAGELVNAAEVQAAYADLCSVARNLLLGVPNKLKQHHPELDRTVLVTLEGFIRDALEELARGSQTGKAGA